VTVVSCAIAAENGSIRFTKSLNGQVDDGAGTHGIIEVPARTVDSLTAQYGQPDILYMDVEGFECEALKGASETLGKPCDAFIEVHAGCGLERFGGSIQRLLEFFPADRYELFYSADEHSRPFQQLRDEAFPSDSRWFLVTLDKRRPN
jgi:Methyltransferase FkbM domain